MAAVAVATSIADDYVEGQHSVILSQSRLWMLWVHREHCQDVNNGLCPGVTYPAGAGANNIVDVSLERLLNLMNGSTNESYEYAGTVA